MLQMMLRNFADVRTRVDISLTWSLGALIKIRVELGWFSSEHS